MGHNIGYCCINQELRDKDIYTSRTLIRKNFSIEKISKLALQNVKDLKKILQWNKDNNISVFRISSEILPRISDDINPYDFNDLIDIEEIDSTLKDIGEFAFKNKQNLSFHPDAYICLGTENKNIIKRMVKYLESENYIADKIKEGSGGVLDIPINFHIGGSYGCDYVNTSKRFCEVFKTLSQSLREKIVIENDDKKNCWGVKELHDLIYNEIGTPITFDFHHYLFKNSAHKNLSLKDEFDIAAKTWGGRSMQVHYSQSPTDDKLIPKHSDYIRNSLPSWVNEYHSHIHLEAKAKEKAVKKYVQDFLNKP